MARCDPSVEGQRGTSTRPIGSGMFAPRPATGRTDSTHPVKTETGNGDAADGPFPGPGNESGRIMRPDRARS